MKNKMPSKDRWLILFIWQIACSIIRFTKMLKSANEPGKNADARKDRRRTLSEMKLEIFTKNSKKHFGYVCCSAFYLLPDANKKKLKLQKSKMLILASKTKQCYLPIKLFWKTRKTSLVFITDLDLSEWHW